MPAIAVGRERAAPPARRRRKRLLQRLRHVVLGLLGRAVPPRPDPLPPEWLKYPPI